MILYQDRTSQFKLGNATNTLVIPLGDGTGLVQFQRSSLKSASPRGHCDYALITLSQLHELFPASGVTVPMDDPSISLLSQRQGVNGPSFKDLAKAAGIKLATRTGVGDLKKDELEAFVQLPLSTQHNLQIQASWLGPKKGPKGLRSPITHLVAKIFLGIPKSSNTKVVYEDFCTNNLTYSNLSAGTTVEMNTFGRQAIERLVTLRKHNPLTVEHTNRQILQENADLKATNETMLHELEGVKAQIAALSNSMKN